MRINKDDNTIIDDNNQVIIRDIKAKKITVDQDLIVLKLGHKYSAFNKVPWHQKDNGNIRVEIEENKHLSIYEFCHLNHKILENSKVKIY